jgi:hypothetical protein
MLELTDTNPDVSVQQSEYKRLLGFPAQYELTGRTKELADWAGQWYSGNGKPWIYALQMDGLALVDGHVRISGVTFSSKRLSEQLAEARADNAVLVAVSAGKQCEEKALHLWKQEKPDEYFFLEVYGSAVVEHLIARAADRICDWADQHRLAVLPHYSPGYPGWDITDQNRILGLIRQQMTCEFPDEISVMDTGMLQPKKSLLALFGITPHLERVERPTRLIPCENCSLSSCQYRRVPYRRSLSQIENVLRLQPSGNPNSGTRTKDTVALNPNAKYSVSTPALQKWSRERLQLKILHDRSVEARFRYEGTTCSNFERSLEFDYHIKLGSAEEGYKIVDATCVPAPDDTGHTYMCEYTVNPESLMRSIATEKPLVGRSLKDVFIWERQYDPAGCYCNAESREHKWGLVLEVLHYALVQHEESRNG